MSAGDRDRPDREGLAWLVRSQPSPAWGPPESGLPDVRPALRDEPADDFVAVFRVVCLAVVFLVAFLVVFFAGFLVVDFLPELFLSFLMYLHSG